MLHMLVITPLFRIINDPIMEVEAINLTASNLAQKLVCLADIEGGKLTLSMHRWKVPQIIDFNHKRTSSLVACIVDESHTVETCAGIAGQLRIVVKSNHCYPKVLQRFA